MISLLGLHPPDILHRGSDDNSIHLEPEGAKLKCFQWNNQWLTRGNRRREYHAYSTSSGKPSMEGNMSGFQALATVFDSADQLRYSDKASSGHSSSLSDLVEDFRRDIERALQLYSSPTVSESLDAWPDKREWVEKTLFRVQSTVNDNRLDTDSKRMEEDGSELLQPRPKFDWLQSHRRRLLRKEQLLKGCQHDLVGAIHIMQSVEMCGISSGIVESPIFEAPVRPWLPTKENNVFRGPYSRQKHRMHQNNTSVSSIASYGVGSGSVDSSPAFSFVAELPGIIPDVHAHSEISDPCSSPNLDSFHNMNLGHPNTLKRSHAQSGRIRSSSRASPALRASIEVIRPQTTMSDTSFRRSHSAPPEKTTTTAPVSAKRCRARTVNIIKPAQRQKYTLLTLPDVQSQPSLIEEMIDWVLSTPPNEPVSSKEQKRTSAFSFQKVSAVANTDAISNQEPSWHITSTIEIVDKKSINSPDQDGRTHTVSSENLSNGGQGPKEKQAANDKSFSIEDPHSPIRGEDSTHSELRTSSPSDCLLETHEQVQRPARTDDTKSTLTIRSSTIVVSNNASGPTSNDTHYSQSDMKSCSNTSSDEKYVSVSASQKPGSADSTGAENTISLGQDRCDSDGLIVVEQSPHRTTDSDETSLQRVKPGTLNEPALPLLQLSVAENLETEQKEMTQKPLSAQAKRQAAHRRRMKLAYSLST